MKRILTGNDNRIKRRISAVMAGVIVLTTIGSVTYLKQKTVQAKETLYSIEKVINDLRIKKSDFKILEIVPDTVSGNVVFEYVSGNQTGEMNVGVTQYPGFLGYYVGGSEPLRDDVDDIVNKKHLISFDDSDIYETTLDSSSLRYKVVESIYDAVKKNQKIYDEEKGPFSLAEGYSEIRQGEYIISDPNNLDSARIITDLELETGLANSEIKLIERESGYIDTAKGVMKPMEAGAEEAHYVLKYSSDVTDEEIDKNDPSFKLFDQYRTYCLEEELSENRIYYDSNDDFIINCSISNNDIEEDDEDNSGDEEDIVYRFDPYIIADDTDMSDIYAVFEALYTDQLSVNEINSGYRVIDATPIDKETIPASGTPIYTFNVETGKYEYYRNCDDEFINELTSSLKPETTSDSLEPNDVIITSKDVLNRENHSSKKSEITLSVLNEEKTTTASEDRAEDIATESEDETLSESSELQFIEEDQLQYYDETESNSSLEEDSSENTDNISNENEINNEVVPDTNFYVLTFAYFDYYEPSELLDNDTGFYGIRFFKYTDRENGAQYSLSDTTNLIIPNLMNKGVIGVKKDRLYDNLVYSYSEKCGQCNFRWYGDEESENVYRITGAKIYYSYGIENREWFKRFVFDRDCYPYDVKDEELDTASRLNVKVVRKTASEVRPYDHKDKTSDIIGKAANDTYTYRMIALMAGDGSYCLPNAEYNQYAAGIRDISSDVYTQILYRAYKNKDSVPIIVDHTILDNENSLETEYKDSLMYNLAYALSLKNGKEYSDMVYSMSGSIESGKLANTNLSPKNYSDILDYNGGDFVNGNIYMYNRRDKVNPLNIVNLSFNVKFSPAIISAGFSEVEKDIEKEKKYRAADISLKDRPLTNDQVTEATVIRYIIGYESVRSTTGKGEITVLELEPTRCFDLAVKNTDITSEYSGSNEFEDLAITETGDNGEVIKKVYKGELYYKNNKFDPILDQKGLKITLKQMTTSEFVGHVEDLNATYDLIYIGMNTGEKASQKTHYVIDSPAGETLEWHHRDAAQSEVGEISESNGWQWKYNYDVAQNHPDWGKRHTKYEKYEGKYHYVLYNYWWDIELNPARGRYDLYRYIITEEQGHNEISTELDKDEYGGFHHRMSTAEDVRDGRAVSANQIITDYNDNNMDGLVYCNVGDMAYISETVGGSLKIWNGRVAEDGTKLCDWPEYVGGKRYLSDEDEMNHNETRETYVKGYDYIKFSNNSDLGYDGNYSLYRTRYSGNDITKDNMNALIDYSKAGYPIILADGFYKDYDKGTRKGTINTCTVDTSSYMYEAVTTINKDSSDKNVFTQSYVPEDLFKWYVINLGKPLIEMTDDTCRIAQTSTVYLGEDQKTGDGHYNAYYRFKIDSMGTAGADTRYNIGLYIDINADGKYSRKSEGIAFTSLKDYNSSATITPSGTDSETKMPVYSLEPGHEYEARCKLSGSFVGCLPWRLSVSQIGNPYRRNNADGYYAIKNNDRNVRILQIRQDNGYTWNMKADYDTEGSIFKRLIQDTEYMPFKITGKDGTEGPDSITVSEFEDHAEVTEKTAEGYYSFLQKNYDMVILGFADIYHGPNITAAKGIKKYIQNGYSVLFTHDCTSFVNSYNRTSRTQSHGDIGLLGDDWGYEFNSLIRNLVGMDRYDVLAESKHENEKPYKPRSNRSIVLNYETHGFTYHIINHWGYQRSTNVLAPVDMSWAGNPGGHNSDEYPKYLAWDGSKNQNNNGFSDDVLLPYANLVDVSLGSGQYGGTTYVSQINKGQITQYPYVLKERFSVAQTHSQYYQLDLTADDDHDDESDIVVWYCISDVTDDPAGWSRTNAGLHTSEKNMYSVSPNDVRNNYYIYNKGNVTYSGVGHSTPTGEDEIKLFINTMIASYRTGLHEPDLAVVDSYREDPNKVRHLYVSYDDEIRKAVIGGSTAEVDDDTVNVVNPADATDVTKVNKNSDIDNTVDMYFNAEQVSLVQNASSIDHSLYARVFLKDDGATHTIGYYCGNDYVEDKYKDIKVTPLDLTGRVFAKDSETPLEVEKDHTNTVIDGVEINLEFMNGCVKCTNGATYKVKVPVTNNLLWGGSEKSDAEYDSIKKTRDIYVVVRDYASYKNSSDEVYKVSLTKWAVDQVDLARVEVFDLE